MTTYTYPKHTAKHNTPVSNDPDALLTVAEVSKLLRVDTTTCRRWIVTGAMDAVIVKLPGKNRAFYRIRRRTLDALLGEKGAER